MTSSLSEIPAEKRRQLAAALGLFSVLFVAVGATAATGASSTVVKVFVAIAIVVAVLLALVGWGVLHSVKVDKTHTNLDAAIEEAIRRSGGGALCDCGHEHDPDELHITDDPCAQDGQGHECSHTCDTCVLSTMRAPVAAAADPSAPRRRPSPTPR